MTEPKIVGRMSILYDSPITAAAICAFLEQMTRVPLREVATLAIDKLVSTSGEQSVLNIQLLVDGKGNTKSLNLRLSLDDKTQSGISLPTTNKEST